MAVRDRLPQVPSSISGELGEWLNEVRFLLNNTPQLSYFSAETPNSNLTGIAGDIAVNIGSTSSTTRVWQKGGSNSVPDTQNWITLRVGPA